MTDLTCPACGSHDVTDYSDCTLAGFPTFQCNVCHKNWPWTEYAVGILEANRIERNYG